MSRHFVALCIAIQCLVASEASVKSANRNRMDLKKSQYSKRLKTSLADRSFEDYSFPRHLHEYSDEDSSEEGKFNSRTRPGKRYRVSSSSEESIEKEFKSGSRSLAQTANQGEVAQQMEPVEEPPPTVWQSFIAEPLRILNAIPDFCQCEETWSCTCCIGIDLKVIGFKNNICIRATQGQDVQTNSKHMIHVTFLLDKIKALDFSVSEREPPSLCVYTVPINIFRGCVQLADIAEDPLEKTRCTCVDFSLHFQEKLTPFLSFKYQCMCLGKPWPNSKKRLFHFGTVLELLKEVKARLLGALAGMG